MALRIKENNGKFMISGKINAITAKNFKNHIEQIFRNSRQLTIDIENVTEIDGNGMKVLKTLFQKAAICKKAFKIVGYGCKEVYDDYRADFAA